MTESCRQVGGTAIVHCLHYSEWRGRTLSWFCCRTSFASKDSRASSLCILSLRPNPFVGEEPPTVTCVFL